MGRTTNAPAWWDRHPSGHGISRDTVAGQYLNIVCKKDLCAILICKRDTCLIDYGIVWSMLPQKSDQFNLTRDVVVFSTADWDHPFWTNKQHVTLGLANEGFRVLYVETIGLRRPTIQKRDLLRMGRRMLKGVRGLTRVHERIWVYSPLVIPFHENKAVEALNHAILVTYLRLITTLIGFNRPILWTYNPATMELVQRLRRSMLIYHCVDDLSAAPGMPSRKIRSAEETLLNIADLIFATSRALFRRCTESAPGKTHYFPNVADYDHFSTAMDPGPIPQDLASIARPRIGFIGAISSYKVNFDLISAVAEERREWNWVLIGQVGEGQPTTSVDKLKKKNIHILGQRDYRVLPSYLRGFDVAALPCQRNDYTHSMFPMKFFEYLAAGKPVVATPLDALSDYSHAFYVADSAQEFIEAVDKCLMGRVPDKFTCLELARSHTWGQRLRAMVKLLEESWNAKNRMNK
jgi:glycosyltransferase involved in cell wall biosynthesis